MDLMAMFVQLQHGEPSLFKLNFGVITLPAKKKMQVGLSNTGLYVY
jgi:hypothetical protein